MKDFLKNTNEAIIYYFIAIVAVIIVVIVNNALKQKTIDENLTLKANARYCRDLSVNNFKDNLTIDSLNSTLDPKFFNSINEDCNSKENKFFLSCINRKINHLTEYQSILENFYIAKNQFYEVQYSQYLNKASKECSTTNNLPDKLTLEQLNDGYLAYEERIIKFAKLNSDKIQKLMEQYDEYKSHY